MIELIRYFLYLGITGFGGPLVLVQQMREHYAEKEKKISEKEFDQAFALIKAMPGPVAFQMAVYLGKRFYGFSGAFLAGFCLVLPAFLLMLVAGFFYDLLVGSPQVSKVLEGLLYSASAVILMSLKNLINSNKKESLFWIFILINLVLSWFQILPEPVLIISFGLLAVLYAKFISSETKSPHLLLSVSFLFFDWEKIYQLGKVCLYAGAVVFGTGFALLPVLKTNLVDIHQLISIKQFNDGVVFGQMTPGPITITASFLGYQVSGFSGALAATCTIFFFPFLHMSTWFPYAISWLGRQKWIQPFVMGATAAVVAGIATTVIHMNMESVVKPIFWLVFLGSFIWVYKKSKTPLILVLLSGGLINLFLSF